MTEPRTPGDLLKQALDNRGIKPTHFGRMIGRDYQAAYRWIRDIGFGKRNQERAAEALKLPPDYFTTPDRLERLEYLRQRVFARFVASPYGQTATPNEVRFLDSLQFHDPAFLPSVTVYQLLLAHYRGNIGPTDLEAAIAENEAAERENSHSKRANAQPKRSPTTPKK